LGRTCLFVACARACIWGGVVGRGAAFGLSHTLGQLVLFRPANRHPSLPNLYFVGASTTPGNGVPLVLTGAAMAAARILKDVPS
jgi:phytoene dehydrogenase-like protein